MSVKKVVFRIVKCIIGLIFIALAIAFWKCGFQWIEWCGRSCDCVQVAINNTIVILQFMGKSIVVISGILIIVFELNVYFE